jgi:hypothetical protein
MCVFRAGHKIRDILYFYIVFQNAETTHGFLNNSKTPGLETLFWREVAGSNEQGNHYSLPAVKVEKGA